MRIHPRYFNRFMVIVAVIVIFVIGVSSLLYLGKQEQRFLDRLEGVELSQMSFLNSEGDTLSIENEHTAVLLFWATWSDRSLEALNDLYQWHDENPDFDIIAAYVKDAPELVSAYEKENDNERFHLVNGTPAYQELRVPGIPSAIVFDERGNVLASEVGEQKSGIWHSLTHGEQVSPD